MNEPNVFTALSTEWERIARSAAARRALRRWQDTCPALESAATPEDVVAACHHGTPAERNGVLAAVLSVQTGEPLATRAALQAMLPGLWNLATRSSVAITCVGPGHPWSTRRELEHDVVAFGAARLTTAAVRAAAWPAVKVLDGVRDDLRSCRTANRTATLDVDELDERWPAETDGRTAAEQAASLLVAAVDAGILTARDAGALYTTRVLGHRTQDIAAVIHYDADTIRQRRCRAVRRLARAVASGELPVAA